MRIAFGWGEELSKMESLKKLKEGFDATVADACERMRMHDEVALINLKHYILPLTISRRREQFEQILASRSGETILEVRGDGKSSASEGNPLPPIEESIRRGLDTEPLVRALEEITTYYKCVFQQDIQSFRYNTARAIDSFIGMARNKVHACSKYDPEPAIRKFQEMWEHIIEECVNKHEELLADNDEIINDLEIRALSGSASLEDYCFEF